MSEELETVECPMCEEEVEVPEEISPDQSLTCDECGHVFTLEELDEEDFDDEEDDWDDEDDEDEE